MAEKKLTSEETAVEKKDAKAKKAKKEKKDSRVLRYLRELKGEFKKITWPPMSTVVRNTLVTLAMCAFVAVIVCLVDFGLGALVNWLLSL